MPIESNELWAVSWCDKLGVHHDVVEKVFGLLQVLGIKADASRMGRVAKTVS